MATSSRETLRHQRLLRDIAELQESPYPNIKLHVIDLTQACLTLTPDGYFPLHLTIRFQENYPLSPPQVTIESRINHPNVFGSYICASILNTAEGYTPAYTLKGICIQLLSFFGSDSLDQYVDAADLRRYKPAYQTGRRNHHQHLCDKCGFGTDTTTASVRSSDGSEERSEMQLDPPSKLSYLKSLPNEILLEILGYLEVENLTTCAQAWPRIGEMITRFALIRRRELQCFVLKKTHLQTTLGVGVSVVGAGRQGRFQSEFDLLSEEAYSGLRIRQSVHHIEFQYWLPLPLSRRHWNQVWRVANANIIRIAAAANLTNANDKATMIFAFMNDIVVRLNLDLERQADQRSSASEQDRKSTLRYASEKAIESYFHLFHLLLCLATGPGGKAIVAQANTMIQSFADGKRDKKDVPNLGYLLIALLISDIDVTEQLMKDIIVEAITRNVVWLLDSKGAGRAELGYLEEDEVSQYRLKKTFQGSRTSYRLLMFSELFRRTARPSPIRSAPATPSPTTPAVKHASADAVVVPKISYSAAVASYTPPPTPSPTRAPSKKSLLQLREELFESYGAPPPGTAARLASEVRRLQQIDDFPSFLREMGLEAIPSAKNFTSVLRDTVRASVTKGYSSAVPEQKLVSLRIMRDPELDREAIVSRIWAGDKSWTHDTLAARKVEGELRRGWLTFFPNQSHGRSSRGERGGRGRGRGRGHHS